MKYFDHFAKSKSTRIGQILHLKTTANTFKIINKFISNVDINILEIGPGKGDLATSFLKNNFLNYDVVEPNDRMRKSIEKQGVRNAKDYMIPYIDEADSSYDVIIISDVFEHLNGTNDAKIFISETERVLKNMGYIFIISPDFFDWGLDFWNCDFSHSNPTSIRRVIQLFYNNNIKSIYCNYMYSCFTGFLGKAINSFIKLATFYCKGNSIDSKFYKLRLTFLRRFIIVGQKTDFKSKN